MITVTASDVLLVPWSSVARILNEYVPAPKPVHGHENGSLDPAPSLVVPWKNSTLVTVGNGKLASAVIIIFVGKMKACPSSGEVIRTGGSVRSPLTANTAVTHDCPGFVKVKLCSNLFT